MTKRVLLRGTGLILAVGMMAGCATAPTQEMSDARQAVQAARDVDATQHTPVAMGKAEQDLTQAEHQLRKREGVIFVVDIIGQNNDFDEVVLGLLMPVLVLV